MSFGYHEWESLILLYCFLRHSFISFRLTTFTAGEFTFHIQEEEGFGHWNVRGFFLLCGGGSKLCCMVCIWGTGSPNGEAEVFHAQERKWVITVFLLQLLHCHMSLPLPGPQLTGHDWRKALPFEGYAASGMTRNSWIFRKDPPDPTDFDTTKTVSPPSMAGWFHC